MAFAVSLLLYDEFLGRFRTGQYTWRKWIPLGLDSTYAQREPSGFWNSCIYFSFSKRRRCKLGPLRPQYCLQIGKDAFGLRIQIHTCRCIRSVRRLMFNENIWGGFLGFLEVCGVLNLLLVYRHLHLDNSETPHATAGCCSRKKPSAALKVGCRSSAYWCVCHLFLSCTCNRNCQRLTW